MPDVLDAPLRLVLGDQLSESLAGLRDRAAGMGGTFAISSPDGGPTVVTVTLPMVGVGSASGTTTTTGTPTGDAIG